MFVTTLCPSSICFKAYAHQFPVPCLSNIKYLRLDSEKDEIKQYFGFNNGSQALADLIDIYCCDSPSEC